MGGWNQGWLKALAIPLAAYGLERAVAFAESRRGRLPGDELVPDPLVQTTHDTVIDAVPGRVWPWLAQMGAGRAGWDADRILPEHQRIAAGDILADGPPGTAYFEVEIAEPERVLALLSDTHLATMIPPSWHTHIDVGGTFSWVFVLEPLDAGRTRLTIRSRATFHPRAAKALLPLLRVVDYLTTQRMLAALKRRAEATVPVGQARPGHPVITAR